MTETKTYAAMLYRLAEEIDSGDVLTAEPEAIREAAQRMDEQTVEINQLRKEQDAMLADLATAEQDSRQKQARIDRLERERDDLLAKLEQIANESTRNLGSARIVARAAIAAMLAAREKGGAA